MLNQGTHPLAGTVPRSGDPDTDERLARGLLGSAKERQEHRVVVNAVEAGLTGVCDRLDVPAADNVHWDRIKTYHVKIDRLLTGIPEVTAKWRETFNV